MKYLLMIFILLCNLSLMFAQTTSCSPVPTQIKTGDLAQVSEGLSNRLRYEPSTSAEQIGMIEAGEIVTIINGYICANDAIWWQVDYQGTTGWTVEIVNGSYALIPLPTHSFNGIRFALPMGYFDTDFVGEIIPEVISTHDMPTSHPEYIHFRYDDNYKKHGLSVYPRKAYHDLEPYVGDIMVELETLLIERPLLDHMDTLPFVLRLGAKQDFVGRASYVDGENIKGIEYLTRFTQTFVPIGRDSLTYTFQGVTRDGEYYVSLTMPVTVEVLPLEPPPLQYTATEAELETYNRHRDEMRSLIEQAPSTSMQPTMETLRQIVLTLATDYQCIEGSVIEFQDIQFTASEYIVSEQVESYRLEERITQNEFLPYQPESIQFVLDDKQSFLSIYPLNGFVNIDPTVAGSVAWLAQILDERPSLAGNYCLPSPNQYNGWQDIAIRARYIDSVALHGIAYLTRFSQQWQRYASNDLQYTFQGFYDDYYVTLTMPVHINLLPEIRTYFIYDDSTNGYNSLLASYRADIDTLSSMAPKEVEPTMESLDTLVQSLIIPSDLFSSNVTVELANIAPLVNHNCYPGLNLR